MTKAINSFAVELPNASTDPNFLYKKELLKHIESNYPNMTVSGQNPPAVRRGVNHASYGNLLTFGTSKTHDIEWVERPSYACEKGYTPVYNLTKDWNKITRKLKELNDELYPENLHLSNGTEVEFHKNFVKVGYKRVSYDNVRFKVTLASLIFSNEDIEAMYFNLMR